MRSKRSNNKCSHSSTSLVETEESEEEDKENDKAEDDKENELTVEDKVRLLTSDIGAHRRMQYLSKCHVNVFIKAHLYFIWSYVGNDF